MYWLPIIIAFVAGGVIGAKIGARRARGESWSTIVEAGFGWILELVERACKMVENAYRKTFKKNQKIANTYEQTT